MSVITGQIFEKASAADPCQDSNPASVSLVGDILGKIGIDQLPHGLSLMRPLDHEVRPTEQINIRQIDEE
jgi:hypothetical protein